VATRATIESPADLAVLIGDAPPFLDAVNLARRFAPTELPILLIGATGTGKELLAQHIHRWSGRAGKLVDVNCAAIPQEIADSILFGHRRGAFSDAIETRVGLMEDADGGTFFLDELCSLPLAIQGKLLRALESGAVRRVGDTTMSRAGFRAICTTQVRLDPRVAEGSFRLDLLQRLGGVQIELPPLVERGRDTLLLAHAFATAVGRSVSTDGDAVLLAHRWSGNVRELRWAVERARWLTHDLILDASVLEYAIALGDTGRLDADAAGLVRETERPRESGGNGHLAPGAADVSPFLGEQPQSLDELRRRHVRSTVQWCGGDTQRAAEFLGISRTHVYRLLAQDD
jgi:DNA-binding NtrC family response regulator